MPAGRFGDNRHGVFVGYALHRNRLAVLRIAPAPSGHVVWGSVPLDDGHEAQLLVTQEIVEGALGPGFLTHLPVAYDARMRNFPFEREGLTRLFRYGYDSDVDGCPWANAPPELPLEERIRSGQSVATGGC